MKQAIWNGRVLAKSDQTILIEGNHYFPPDSLNSEFLKPSDSHTICPWKGVASYYDVVVDGQVNKDAAWYYPVLKQGAARRAGKDFANYVAFWQGVEIS